MNEMNPSLFLNWIIKCSLIIIGEQKVRPSISF